MDKKKNIIKSINLNHFELPYNLFKSKIVASKLSFISPKHEIKSPCLYICNKTTPYDKYLISSVMLGNFVFIKDYIIKSLHQNKLSKTETSEILKEILWLKQNGFSVVIFPEKRISVLGKCEKLPISVTEFIFETGFEEIKYFYLIGTHMAYPVWAKEIRRVETKYLQQLRLDRGQLEELNQPQRCHEINKCMPSSASIYIKRHPIHIKNDHRAENIDSIMYCCPKCKKLFSIYSEFNCIKCSECGAFIEFEKDGSLHFSNTINNFDEIEEFLFEQLKLTELGNSELVTYNDVTLLSYVINNRPANISGVTLKIFADHFVIEKSEIVKKNIKISEIVDIILHHGNILEIELKHDKILIQGKNKEKLYFMIDLLKLYNS